MKKNNFMFELVFSTFSFVLLVPLMLLVYMFNSDSCNFYIWTGIIYFVPLLISVFLQTIFPNSSLLTSKFVIGSEYIVFQFVINTIVLIKLFYKLIIKKEKLDDQFWLCIGIVLLNYIMMAIFMYVYVNMGGCNVF